METATLKAGYNENVNTERNHVIIVRKLLSALFIVIPIVAGLDKFFNVLTDWPKYVNPLITGILGINASLLMNIVGVVEIAAGVIVLLNRKLGAYIVAAWLLGIALQLIAGWMFVDVAVRDIVMAAAAFSLALLSD